MKDLPASERPLSEQYRIVAKEWIDLDNAARLLEATKDAVFSQMVVGTTGSTSVAAAERTAKAHPNWREYLEKMVRARTDANLKKVHLEYIRMKHQEWISMDANARAERKL